MGKINKVSVIVEKILRTIPSTRDDDFLLYGFVLNEYGYSKDISFWTLRGLVLDKAVPSMKCVGRCRRKLQELYPEELHAVQPVEKGRKAQIPEYRKYASDMR